MLRAITLLLLFQLSGEVLARGFGVRIPGPVLGMVLLFLFLLWRKHVPHDVKSTASNLLRHLSLLFVPAAVGVIQQLDRLANEGLRLTVVLILSVAITMAVSALTLHLLMRHRRNTSEIS